ncbi:Craniofacial development protein 1 [Mortierella polycephala]|uniref:SWR1-complex protein 5 n=1 Tax=Mortierella polycephala TaxID=41804 RepID=A0A9P6PTK3_9FUNG|nr:Craniofacial development protein 1 [Mortierella polycephala]
MGNSATEKPPKQQVNSDSDSDSSDDEDYIPDDKVDVQSDGEDESDSSDLEHRDKGSNVGDEYTTSRSGKRRVTSTASSSNELKKPKTDQARDQAEAQNRKSKVDALWAELNAPIAKPTSRPDLLSAATATGSGTETTSSQFEDVGGSSSRMVTITTTYDFAGETVSVTKDVSEDSKEAKDFALKNKTGNNADLTIKPASSSPTSSQPPPSLTAPATTKDSILSTAEHLTKKSPDTSLLPSTTTPNQPSSSGPKITTRPSVLDSLATKGPVRYVRKKSNLDALAATYGVKKPPKLNTLEKSKLDWKNFVGKEGIEDELKHHNKDGYMERVAFLQRTDERRDIEYQILKKKR